MLIVGRISRSLLARGRGATRYYISWNKNPFEDIEASKFYKPRVSVEDFLLQNAIEYRANDRVFRIKECIFCSKPHYNDMTNLYTLNIDRDRGVYYCHRCQSKGTWMDFRGRYLGLGNSDRVSILMNEELNENFGLHSNTEVPPVEYFIYEKELWNPSSEETLNYLHSRGFQDQTIKKYRVGAGVEGFYGREGEKTDVKVIYFPMCLPKHKPARSQQSGESQVEQQQKWKISKLKIRGASKATKMYMRQSPTGPQSGFFGLHTITPHDKMVVITEGEFDAMAVHQATGYPAISLPQGANSLPDSLVMYLDHFDDIVLWLDNDEAGKMGEEKIAFKLGEGRTRIVRHSHKDLKDANDFLLKKPEVMKALIDSSKTKAGQNILKFGDILEAVKKRIHNFEQFEGAQISWLPFFNRKVKGVRNQQLTIVSGSTGCGKTTFLSQLSLDLAKKDIPVLWGSFEIKNQVLVTNMLIQFSEINLIRKENLHHFQRYADRFSQLPISWLSFHGAHDYEKVLSTIEYAIQKSNVSLVVLDTLQFFLSGQAQGSKKFDLQDIVMARLRKIATNFNVHIIVVIHPRKTDDNEDIQINSIYGSSKSTQEADNVWIIQKREHFRVLDIKKNRFDGQVGKAGIGFDRELKSFFQLTKSDLVDLKNETKQFSEIVYKHRHKLADDNFSLEDMRGEEDSPTSLLDKKKRDDYKKY